MVDSVSDLPLFKHPGRTKAPKARDPELARKVERAAEVFNEQLLKARYDGLAVGWIRPALQRAGLISGGEKGRALSWFGLIPKAAGAIGSGRFVFLNGQRRELWLHPDFAGNAERADALALNE